MAVNSRRNDHDSPRISKPALGILFAAACAASVLAPAKAFAGSGLRVSFGESLYLVQPPNQDVIPKLTSGQSLTCYPCWDGNVRQPVDLEIMPYLDFGVLTLDGAFLFQLEHDNSGFITQFRPGVRIFPFMGLYIRASLQLTAANLSLTNAYFQYNLSAGLGWQFTLGSWGIFAEFNLNPSLRIPFSMPIEIRLGVLHKS